MSMRTNEEMAVEIQNGGGDILELWLGVRRYAAKQADRWARAWSRPGEVEDLVQSGFLALYPAISTFQAGAGSFIGWYGYYLKTSFVEVLGLRGQHPDPLAGADSLDVPLSADDPEGGTMGDLVDDGGNMAGDVEEKVYQQQLRAAMMTELDGLPPEQRAVIYGIYYRGQTRRSMSEKSTPDRVRRAERKALATLRRSKALQQFCDDRTDFYRGGVHSVENAVVHREILTERFVGFIP